jgi:ABC-type antimicrobial peptide transport system permease subunit
VREWTREIGLRVALGATTGAVLRLLIGQMLRLVVAGLAMGLAAAAAFTRLVGRLLYHVDPLDPWTFAGTTLVLLCVVALASFVPARRGMRMAPVEALRTE